MTVMKKLAESGNLSDEQQRRIQSEADHFEQALQDPEFFKEAADVMGEGKGIWDKVKSLLGAQVPGALASAAVMGGGSLAIAGGKAGYDAIMNRIHKRRAFEGMMEANPQLAEADPTRVQRIFESLFRFNPAYARDPLVAGTFVDSSLADAKMHVGQIGALVDAHQKLQGRGGGGTFDSAMDFFSKSMPRAPWVDPAEQAMSQAQEQRQQAQHQRQETEHGWKGEDQARREKEHRWAGKEYGAKMEKAKQERELFPHKLTIERERAEQEPCNTEAAPFKPRESKAKAMESEKKHQRALEQFLFEQQNQREQGRISNEDFLAAQQYRKNMEEAFRAEEAKRKFWEEAQAVDPNDPRSQK